MSRSSSIELDSVQQGRFRMVLTRNLPAPMSLWIASRVRYGGVEIARGERFIILPWGRKKAQDASATTRRSAARYPIRRTSRSPPCARGGRGRPGCGRRGGIRPSEATRPGMARSRNAAISASATVVSPRRARGRSRGRHDRPRPRGPQRDPRVPDRVQAWANVRRRPHPRAHVSVPPPLTTVARGTWCGCSERSDARLG